MDQHTVRFRIRPDGRVEELVEGVRGPGCEQLTERIEARIGSVQQRRSTAEAFQAQATVTAVNTVTSEDCACDQALAQPASHP